MSVDIQKNISLAAYTSWSVGGPAEEFCQPTSLEELIEAVEYVGKKSVTILGGGSNVLINDEGIPGLVICMRKLKGIVVTDEGKEFRLEAWAGTPKVQVLRSFMALKLEPALFLAGLPGDVGGGIVMNAGVGEAIKPREFCEIVEWVEVLRNGKVIRLNNKDIEWKYRHSYGWQPGIIVKVGFVWPNQPVADLREKVKQANMTRLSKQPLDLPSCGSVFRNPPGHKSGALIQECGLKGFSIGGAQVSPKHANFIVNNGGATASDIKKLIEHVQKTVNEKKQIDLQTEVVFL
jgi:UDP-N-acetylmuramate dehydrogenase